MNRVTSTAYARYIGRVGALAVVLGVTGFVSGPGMAWAEETSTTPGDPATSASEATAPSGEQPSTPPPGESGSVTSDDPADADDDPGIVESGASSQSVTLNDGDVVVQSSGGALTSGSDDETEDELVSADDEQERSREHAAFAGAPAGGSSHVQTVATQTAPDNTTLMSATDVVDTPEYSSNDNPDVERSTAADANAPTLHRQLVATTLTQTETTGAALTASIVPDFNSVKLCVCNVIKQVADVVGELIGSIFNPPGGGPTSPEMPVALGVLAWARRQINNLLALPPVAAVVQTVKTIGSRFYQRLVTCGQPVQGLPAEFERTILVTGLNEPTDFRFLPDGRILITEKSGAIKIYENGALNPTPVVTLPLGATVTSERGLSGVEVDPNFDENGYVYVSYTSAQNHLRLSRLTITGSTADLASEVVLLESELEAGNLHHGGEIRFGPDNMLYWSVGENGFGPNSQDLSNIHGKVLRINPHVLNEDGTATVPSGNPFVNNPAAKPQIYAYGFRNPYRFVFTPNDKLLLGDVGDQSWEELNIVTAGADYGWPNAEGVCGGQGCTSVNPVYAYAHTPPPSRAAALTSVLVYTGETFGENYKNKVFIADFTLGWIKVLTFDEQYTSVLNEQLFDTQAGTPVKLEQGPDGNIYQLNIYPGELSVIGLSGGNRAPTAVITATPSNGYSPLTVNFSSAGSQDPDQGTTLTYSWDFGDGNTSTLANPTHTYTTNGAYDVTLTVSDGEETGQATQRIVVGSTAPSVTITSPLHNSLYAAGDTITFTGVASDAEDGPTLPDSAYKWTVVFHHAEHIHPFEDNIIGPSGSITIPRDPHNTANTWYEIRLTVTDSSGLSTSQSVEVRPQIVTVTFNASDPDAMYTIDGIPHKGLYIEDAVVGVERVVNAPSPQVIGDRTLKFDSWSDGQPQTHVITIPGTDTGYTATFVDVTAALLV